MKCLCGSKGCRGFVGGTQETIAARLAMISVCHQPAATAPAARDQCPALSHRTCRPWQHCDGHQVCIEGSYLLPVPYVMRSNFEDTEDASLDPEPIMVTEAEQDAALTAILDQNIGVGANGWDPKLERR